MNRLSTGSRARCRRTTCPETHGTSQLSTASPGTLENSPTLSVTSVYRERSVDFGGLRRKAPAVFLPFFAILPLPIGRRLWAPHASLCGDEEPAPKELWRLRPQIHPLTGAKGPIHADDSRGAERQADKITVAELERALGSCDVIEDYPEDARGHSCLTLGFAGTRPVHAVCTIKDDPRELLLITVYDSSLRPDKWDADFRRRRKP
jgi:hypothetical protein